MPPKSFRLLLISIGNPGPSYAHTYHSAAHTLVAALATHLSFPPFSSSRAHGNGLVSVDRDILADGEMVEWTLWQSTSYMNTSGPGVANALKEWRRGSAAAAGGTQENRGKWVVLHDELDRPLGKVGKRVGQGSARYVKEFSAVIEEDYTVGTHRTKGTNPLHENSVGLVSFTKSRSLHLFSSPSAHF